MARATMKGFLIFDYESRYAEGRAQLVKAIHECKLNRQFHVVEAIENTPEAFQLLFFGGNTGKLSPICRAPSTRCVPSAVRCQSDCMYPS
ncbi:hypothetical protein PsYK624_154790 [Phanerochaete sordida]|uniref:Uncharacterized protein n=1 Tax=Phanerochaete sordida TaxID=48140 RepID=A0A9P3GTB0_9APHY|nr:hypothetical protein PsYK624_154790 [Phanerochaete sordida]